MKRRIRFYGQDLPFEKVGSSRYFLLRRRLEGFVFLLFFFLFFGFLASRMGTSNLLNTIMRTAYGLLTETVFFIMGITVLSGALSKLFVEFGVIRILEFILRPLMRPVYNLPGVASLAAVLSFFSDNPAVLTVARDEEIRCRFTDLELYSLPNFGTSLGMGLVVFTFVSSLGHFVPGVIGIVSAMVGGIVSTRVMQWRIWGEFPNHAAQLAEIRSRKASRDGDSTIGFKTQGTVLERFLNALLDGGKSGVDLGLAVIPGVLIISTLVTLLTFGPRDPSVGYQGLAGEGVPVLTIGAGYLQDVFYWLFGFEHAELIAFPITSLGSVGAALSLISVFSVKGIITGNEIAVFSAMGMCWSGFLSTYAAMYDALGRRDLMLRAVGAQLLGGVCAGVVAHLLYVLLSLVLTLN